VNGVTAVLRAGYRKAQQAMAEAQATAALRVPAAGDDPIMVGPWLSEVGYELLYWIPFLRAAERFGIQADRLIVVSRGGVKEWYGVDRYVDIFDLVSPETYRTKNEERSTALGLKQFSLSPFDREILAGARRRLGMPRAKTLHPSLMFNLFRNFWDERSDISVVRKSVRFQKFGQTAVSGPLPGLPSEYVAVRFYFNNVFPDRPETRAFQADLISRLAEETDVVLLNTEFGFDDHRDIEKPRHPRVHSSAHLMAPQNNLAVQTEIVRKAKAYYGNYGGLSYLPLLCGVPTFAFHWEEGPYFARHGQVVQDALSVLKTPYQNTRVTGGLGIRPAIEKMLTGV
jgi:hypothetical protein